MKQAPALLLTEFEQLRVALAARLAAQAALQGTAIGFLGSVRELQQQAKADAHHVPQTAALEALEVKMAACSRHAEAATLPRDLAVDFAQEVRALRKMLADLQEYEYALQARRTLLTTWDGATETLHPQTLKSVLVTIAGSSDYAILVLQSGRQFRAAENTTVLVALDVKILLQPGDHLGEHHARHHYLWFHHSAINGRKSRSSAQTAVTVPRTPTPCSLRKTACECRAPRRWP